MELDSRLYQLITALASLILFLMLLGIVAVFTYGSPIYFIALMLATVIGIAALLTITRLYRIVELITRGTGPESGGIIEEVDVGRFGYILEDPEHSEQFDLFLDRPNVHYDEEGNLVYR